MTTVCGISGVSKPAPKLPGARHHKIGMGVVIAISAVPYQNLGDTPVQGRQKVIKQSDKLKFILPIKQFHQYPIHTLDTQYIDYSLLY